MSVRWIEPGEAIGAARGEVAVVIPIYGGHDHFVSCLRSVLEHTPADVRILVCDDASPDARSQEFVRELDETGANGHQILYLRREVNVGFPGNVNGAFAAAAPADVVVLNSDCVVADGWLEGLREAAYVDSRVATATALSNNASIVSVPDRGPRPELPPGVTLDVAAAAVRAGSLRIRPHLPTAIGHCVYIRRSALELVGDFDLAFSPGYGEEVDFSQRCLQQGLAHVLADDVFVFHHGGVSLGSNGRRNPVQDQHERMLAQRYSYYHDRVAETEQESSGPLARALGSARRAISGMRVAVDAGILAHPLTGTQIHVLELIAALARTGEARVEAVVPNSIEPDAARALASLEGVRLVAHDDVRALRRDPADVVHRPYQIIHEADLSFVVGLGERVVITNQDLIRYHNPSYFSDGDEWQAYRRTTRAALSLADSVVFFSAHARDDALAEDLVDQQRANVVHIGVDHKLFAPAEPVPAPGVSQLPEDAEVIVCIGTDFRHKNRVFAQSMLEQLQLRHGWHGRLVFVGPSVSEGSSRTEERDFLASRPDVGAAVLELGPVSEEAKAWVYGRARLTLYPTVYEGFGLVPFESADHDVPCMWAEGTSLSELLPDAAAGIVPWNAEESADHALRLMRDESARRENLTAIKDAARSLSWDATAARLIELYRETCESPASPALAIERRHAVMLSEDAMRLVGPGGALPSDVERPLLAVATHRALAAPVFGAIKMGYRVSYRLRRLRGNGSSGG